MKDAVLDSPVLILMAALGICISIFIVIDAHRCKKKRPRHRWK